MENITSYLNSISTKGGIKNFPNEKFDENYTILNQMIFDLYKIEYSFLKFLRKKTLAKEIGSEEDLMTNIKKEFSLYDFPSLGVKQHIYSEIEKILGTALNNFDAQNNNEFNGYIELEQYHTIAGRIIQIIP